MNSSVRLKLTALRPELKAALLPHGEIKGNVLTVDRDLWRQKRAELRPTTAVPRDQWPIWAKAIAMRASRSDRGVGDTVARVIGQFGGDAFKSWYKRTFGKSCHCEKRQAAWNLKYPYA